MKFLLDTNVLSEYTKKEPVRAVINWLEGIPETEMYVSALTLGELNQGIERLPAGKKKGNLILWFDRLIESLEGHILPVDDRVALKWGELCARSLDAGRKPHTMDSLIGATALVNEAVLVTRNTKDFESLGVDLINPWI